MANGEEQTSGTDAAVSRLFICAVLYRSLHHIVAVVFHYGRLEHTYSWPELLAACSDVIAFNLKSFCKSHITFLTRT